MFKKSKVLDNIIKKSRKNIFDTFSLVLTISVSGGVCSIKKHKENNEYISSHFLIILQVVVLLVSVLHFILIPQGIVYVERVAQGQSFDLRNITTISMSGQHFATKLANPIIISLSAIFIRLANLIQMCRNFPKLFGSLYSFDQKMNVDVEKTNDSIYLKALSVVLIVASWPFQIYSLILVSFDSWLSQMVFSFNVYNNFTASCTEYQFICICRILLSRFKKINHNLKNLHEGTVSDDKNIVSAIGDDTALKSASDNQQLINKITKIRDCHKILCECSEKVNEIFNIQLLVTLSCNVMNVLLNFYFAIFGGFKRPSDDGYTEQKVANAMNDVTWGLYYFGRFIFICIATGFLTKEANKVKTNICNTLSISSGRVLKEQLCFFLAYSVSNKVQFKACGFFKIGFSLISSALATGTTYLVILAQFHKS